MLGGVKGVVEGGWVGVEGRRWERRVCVKVGE